MDHIIHKMLSVFIVTILLFSCTEAPDKSEQTGFNHDKNKTLDRSSYLETMPDKPLHLLFIHHSVGAQLLADKGPVPKKNLLYKHHPNGGGLRRLLEENNYIVHEATYGSEIGEKTDVCHWNAKFRNQLEKIIITKHQNEYFADNTRNQIVMFKSCYPNSLIKARGDEPGDADSCEKTITNFKAAYNALLSHLSSQPETLFVVLTAPPFAKPAPERVVTFKDKGFLLASDDIENVGRRAREFNNWLKDRESGWLKDYPFKNIAVFDLYDVLTDNGASNWSMYPSREGRDSHPNSEGNTKAAQELIQFLNNAVIGFRS